MFRFIWGGGSISGTFERIKRDTLHLSKDKGELEVPDLGLKMKAFAVRHLAEFLEQEGLEWKDSTYYFTKLKLVTLGLSATDNSTPSAWSMPLIYKNVIDCFILE